jgi:hypothetical protein
VGVVGPSDALFWASYTYAWGIPVVLAKLENFLNQYAFCRNTALVAFVDAAFLYWSYRWGKGLSSTFIGPGLRSAWELG